jgi:hypothetical protein
MMSTWQRFGLSWMSLWVLTLSMLGSARAWAEAAPLPDESSSVAPQRSKNYALRPRGRDLDVVANVRAICRTATEAQRTALSCGDPYWEVQATRDLSKAGAPMRVFRPGGHELCSVVDTLNNAEVHPEPLRELIDACGYRENLFSALAVACGALELEGKKQDKVIAAFGPEETKKKLKDFEDARLHRARITAYATRLYCKSAPWQTSAVTTRWNGDPAKSPLITAGGETICDAVKAEEPPKGITAVERLRTECKIVVERSGALVSPAQVLLMTVAQGFGDFLKSRAKEELIDFAVEQLGRQFCVQEKKINGRVLFPKTCNLLFSPKTGQPEDTAAEPNIKAITSGQFQKVFMEDLTELPGKLVELLPVDWDGLYVTPEQGKALKAILEKTAEAFFKIAKYQGQNYFEFFAKLETEVRQEVGDDKDLQCTLDKKSALTAPCMLTLILTTAAIAKDEFPTSPQSPAVRLPHVKMWLEHASVQFCQHYGPRDNAKARPKDGACVYGADSSVWQEIQNFINALIAFHDRMGEIAEQARKLRDQGKFPLEIASTALPEIADAIEKLDATIIGALVVLAPKQGTAQASIDKLVKVLDLLGHSLKVVSAGVKRDFRAIAGAVRIVVTMDVIQNDVSPAFKKGLLFACDLAEAKTSDDVRKVFEDYAAPRDTYRAKYGATGKLRWTLNGYVGFFGMVKSPPLWHEEASAGYAKPSQGWFQPLATPVGFDMTIPISDPKNHIGLMLAIIDPLELRTTDTDGTTVPELGGILAPGAFFRVGILKSPIAFMIGGRWQPLLKSTEMCGKVNCWQGPASLMAGFAVDVPVAPLNY